MLGIILAALLLQGPRNLQVDEHAVLKPPAIVTAGTVIPVELSNRLSTKTVQEGDMIYARTVFPITVDDEIVIPVGTSVQGKIMQSERPGKVKGKASLTLAFQRIVLPNGLSFQIYGSLGGSDQARREGEATIEGDTSKGKDAGDVAKAGGAGAVIGGIIRGTKGAVIGGGVSAGVALAGVLLSRGEDLTLDKGTVIEIVLDRDLEI